MDHIRLSNVRHQFTTDSTMIRSTSEVLTNATCNGKLPVSRHRKSSSAPINFNISNGLQQSSLDDIYELLSAYSPRPIVPEFHSNRNGQSTIRICTWNLHHFTLEKAQNLGVKEVVCRTILENGYGVQFY